MNRKYYRELEKALVLCADVWNLISLKWPTQHEVGKVKALQHLRVKLHNTLTDCALCDLRKRQIGFDCAECNKRMKWIPESLLQSGDVACIKPPSVYMQMDTRETALVIRDKAIRALNKLYKEYKLK